VGIYFVASQLLLIPAIYVFTRIDWHAGVRGADVSMGEARVISLSAETPI
jgi:hypothetical protein